MHKYLGCHEKRLPNKKGILFLSTGDHNNLPEN